MKFIKDVIIYGISDTGYEHIKYVNELLKAGVDIVQLRDKSLCDKRFFDIASVLKDLIKRSGKIFIINDRVDLAGALDIDGVHLGSEDLPPKEARKILGRDKIIGYSCHNYEEAKYAQKQCVDYISIGPIFKSQTKKALEPISRYEIELIIKKIKLPRIAIGGINLNNIKIVKELGFRSVAMVSALAHSKNKKKLITEMRKVLEYDSDTETSKW